MYAVIGWIGSLFANPLGLGFRFRAAARSTSLEPTGRKEQGNVNYPSGIGEVSPLSERRLVADRYLHRLTSCLRSLVRYSVPPYDRQILRGRDCELVFSRTWQRPKKETKPFG